MGITLNNDNYFSDQANMDYMSVSQFKDFAGTLMHDGCEATALKKLKRQIPEVMTKPLLVGSYVDSFYEGTLDQFKSKNRDLICTKTSIKAFEKNENTNDLQLLADFKQADSIIERTCQDPLFSAYMNGQKQVIMVVRLFGIDWKIKMDAYHPHDKIVDLKIMKSMNPIWSDKHHMKSDFVRYWGYDIQGAVYQKAVEILTGEKLPFYLACATKEDPANIEIIAIDQNYLDDALFFVQTNLPHVLDVKNGRIKPVACGDCYWCRQAKKLTEPIALSSIIPVKTDNDPENMDMAEPDLAEDTSFVPQPFHLFGNMPTP